MFLTKKHIPRRTFLRGAGVAIGLPLLDCMIPAQTAQSQTAAAPVRRFMGIWHPHGAAPGYWSPLQEGKDFEFSFITKPLEQFRNRLTLISGMDMPEAMANTEEPGGDHAEARCCCRRRVRVETRLRLILVLRSISWSPSGTARIRSSLRSS